MHFGASERKEDHAIESSKRSQKKLHILNMSGILASKYKFLATLFFLMSVSCSLFFLPVNFSSSHGCRVLWSTLQNAFSAPFYTVWLTNSSLVGLGFLERNTVGLTVLLHTRSWSSYWSPIYVLTMWCRPEVFCINCAWVLELFSVFIKTYHKYSDS